MGLPLPEQGKPGWEPPRERWFRKLTERLQVYHELLESVMEGQGPTRAKLLDAVYAVEEAASELGPRLARLDDKERDQQVPVLAGLMESLAGARRGLLQVPDEQADAGMADALPAIVPRSEVTKRLPGELVRRQKPEPQQARKSRIVRAVRRQLPGSAARGADGETAHELIASLLSSYHSFAHQQFVTHPGGNRTDDARQLLDHLDRIEEIAAPLRYQQDEEKAVWRLLQAVSSERMLILGVLANKGLNAIESGVTWGEALELKRYGLDIGRWIQPPAPSDKKIMSEVSLPISDPAGEPPVLLTYEDDSQLVFKAEEVDQKPMATGVEIGISASHPRYTARSIATRQLDKLLGTGVIVETEFAIHDGKPGIGMQLAKGETAYNLLKHPRFGETLKDPGFQRALSNLEWIDAITGQADRNDGNFVVNIDKQGVFRDLKGIDNDVSFGPNDIKLPELRGGGFFLSWGHSHQMGLPELIDRRLADTMRRPGMWTRIEGEIGELLTADEIAQAKTRFQQCLKHIEELENAGKIVNDWQQFQMGGKSVAGFLDDPSKSLLARLRSRMLSESSETTAAPRPPTEGS